MIYLDHHDAQGLELATITPVSLATGAPAPVAQPGARAASAAGGWDPFDVWRTRVRDPRRALKRARQH